MQQLFIRIDLEILLYWVIVSLTIIRIIFYPLQYLREDKRLSKEIKPVRDYKSFKNDLYLPDIKRQPIRLTLDNVEFFQVKDGTYIWYREYPNGSYHILNDDAITSEFPIPKKDKLITKTIYHGYRDSDGLHESGFNKVSELKYLIFQALIDMDLNRPKRLIYRDVKKQLELEHISYDPELIDLLIEMCISTLSD